MSKERFLSPGESIGAYEVVSVLAASGTSVIYEATPHPDLRANLIEMGIKRVAVKLARIDLLQNDRYARKRMVERVDREFQTLFELMDQRHPNIVRVYDFGFEEGAPYYAMELVDGLTLEEVLEDQPRLGQITLVFAHLCGAVAMLHNLSICHRDLKPGNVMMRFVGGAPVLIDFGLCLPPAVRSLTAPYELLGSPWYLSPEYATHWLDEGNELAYVPAPTDDVWALGIILYEILTGGVPWRTNPLRHEALLREIRDIPLVHPSDVYPTVPRAWGDVVMRMLERDVEKRPKRAGELLPLLGEAGSDSDVLPRVPKRRPRVEGPAMDFDEDGEDEDDGEEREESIRWKLAPLLRRLLPVMALAATFGLGYLWGSTRAHAGSGAVRLSESVTKTLEDRNRAAPLGPHLGLAPLASAPLPHQLKAPCPEPLRELGGDCWRELSPQASNGRRGPCPPDVVEVRGTDGPRCLVPVYPPPR